MCIQFSKRIYSKSVYFACKGINFYQIELTYIE